MLAALSAKGHQQLSTLLEFSGKVERLGMNVVATFHGGNGNVACTVI
jgi:hypothetical protein